MPEVAAEGKRRQQGQGQRRQEEVMRMEGARGGRRQEKAVSDLRRQEEAGNWRRQEANADPVGPSLHPFGFHTGPALEKSGSGPALEKPGVTRRM